MKNTEFSLLSLKVRGEFAVPRVSHVIASRRSTRILSVDDQTRVASLSVNYSPDQRFKDEINSLIHLNVCLAFVHFLPKY